MGNVVAAGLGQNPARQAALFGGLAPEVGAMTINKVCGSGRKAVALATRVAGHADLRDDPARRAPRDCGVVPRRWECGGDGGETLGNSDEVSEEKLKPL